MGHHKRDGPRKHGARAQAGRHHDPDDAASGGSHKRMHEQRSERAQIDEGVSEITERTTCKVCGRLLLASQAAMHMMQKHGKLVVLFGLPMVPPPPGPIENAAQQIEALVAEGLAEMRGKVAHRTPDGDALLREAGFA